MLIWAFAAAAAYFVKGLCGFANTLVFTSILSFSTANAGISPIDLLLGYPANLVLAWKNRKHLNAGIYVPLCFLVLAGSLPGIFLLKHADVRSIKLVFGVVVIALGLEMLIRTYQKQTGKPPAKLLLAIIGVASGILCGLFGVGALLAAYVGRVTQDTASFKANISAVFIVENTFRIILYTVLHLITVQTIKTAVLLIPFVVLGFVLGMKSSSILPETTVKRIMTILLILSGISLIIQNL